MMNLRESRLQGGRSKIKRIGDVPVVHGECDSTAKATTKMKSREVSLKLMTMDKVESGLLFDSELDMDLCNSSANPHTLGDAEDGNYSIRSKVEFLNCGFKFLRNEAAETKRCCSEMAEQLKSVVTMLGTQPCQLDQDEVTFTTRQGPSFRQSQVLLHKLESNRENHQLGYRAGSLPVANRDSMFKRIEMPSFDESHIHEWLVDIDHFFTAGGFREEDKLEMVALSVEGRVKKWFAWVLKRGGFHDWLDFKHKLLLRFAESSDDEPETRFFSIEQTGSVTDYISETEENAAMPQLPVYEKANSKKETIPMLDHDKEMYVLSLGLQKTVAVKTKLVHTSANTRDLVQQVDSPTEEEVSVSSDLGSAIQCRSIDTLELNDASLKLVLQTTRVSHSETNCVLQPQRTTEMVKRTESQFVETTSVHYGDCPIQNCFLQEMTFKHGSISAIHQDFGLSSKIAVIDGVVQIDSLLEHASQTLRDANVVRSYHIQVNGLTDVTWLTSERQHLELKRKFNKLWHFKYKPEKVEMKGQHHQVLYLVYLAEHKRDLLRMKGKRTSLRFWLSQLQCVCALVEGLSTMCSIRHILQVMKQFILGDVKFQVKHRWKSKQFGLVSDLVFYVNQIVGRNYSEVSVWGRRLLSRVYPRHLQWLMQLGGLKGKCFLSNEAVVKSVWILNFEGICYTKDYFVRAVRRMICELPARLYNQRLKHSFGEATIQRTSQEEAMVQLQSKEEMRRLWLQLKTKRSVLNMFSLIELQSPVDDSDAVEFLFTQVAGKQSELQTQGSSHASSPIISLSPSLRSSLSSREGVYKRLFTCGLIVEVLIWFFSALNTSDLLKNNVRRQKEKDVQSTHLLHQVLIQQRQKGKKSYKTRMFKYKERTRQVQFSLLHVVSDLWSISCLIWHRWKRKEYHTGDSAMVDVLEWLDRGDTSALNQCIYPCGFVWCSHKSVDTSSRAQHVILTKLEGKLVFLGGSIDRHRLSGLLTWIRELREIETLDGLEALQLEESGSTRPGTQSIKVER